MVAKQMLDLQSIWGTHTVYVEIGVVDLSMACCTQVNVAGLGLFGYTTTLDFGHSETITRTTDAVLERQG